MLRLFSKGCEYALRALLRFDDSRATPLVQARTVCRAARVPEPSARKIFQALVKAGFLEAVSGPRGGYRLRRPARDITLHRLIEAVDGPLSLDGCVLGLDRCADETPCALHPLWKRTKDRLLPALKRTTLADVRRSALKKGVFP